jgi:hypothetical protein
MMAENYAFHFLNREGQLIMIVHMRCANDEAAMTAMPQSGPWAEIEICAADGRMLKSNETGNDTGPGRRLPHAKEYHPDH